MKMTSYPKEDEMRSRCALLLTLLAAAVFAALPSGSSAATLALGAEYVWAQPGTSMVDVTRAEPASIPIAACQMAPVPGADYVWAQPGASTLDVTCAEPASKPLG
jgi:hypothetical protein